MSLEVTYKGSQIAQLTQDGSLTLNTAGKYCEGDIGLTYTGDGGEPSLPPGYTRLKYIEGTGTQYLILPYSPNIKTRVRIRSFRTSSQSYSSCQFGTSNPTCQASGIYIAFGNVADRTGRFNPDYDVPEYTFDKDYIKDEEGNILVNIGATSISTAKNAVFGVVCRINCDTLQVDRIEKSRLYKFEISEDDEVMILLYPALRDSDNEVGAYDVVNDVFYTNAGTGAFVGGLL